jgi:sulfur carrier protein ThiS
MATIAVLNNPFDLTRNREMHAVIESMTIRAWLNTQKIVEFARPTICLVNGQPVLRQQWDKLVIQGDMIVAFIALPQGGGGGGKNPLRAILSIAVAFAAPALGGVIAGSLGITSTIGTALIGAGLSFVGSALVNALIPPPSPSLGGVGNFNISQPSPTYSLQAQGNQARLAEPIPVVYGRHIVFPDFAATPYSEFIGNDQFLYQLHAIGQGEYQIEQIRIEDTPISSFTEITTEIVSPGGTLTLFHPDVAAAPEVAGQELLAIADGGNWVGPFVANPSETLTNKLAIDVIMPRGLYYADDSGALTSRSVTWQVQARLIDDDGDPVGAWATLGTESVTDATNTAIRRTFHYTVAAGRYEVRLLRQDTKDTSARSGHDIMWSGLNSFLQSAADFSGVTLLALKMRATDNLSQRSSRLVNCIVTRKLPIWSGGTWSTPQPTRSIAWAMADILKANYGAKLSDSRIDLAALTALDQLWQTRGDTFDGLFDQRLTVWDALTRVARCGRAVPILQGGIARVIRDELKTLPVALFSPRNIVKGSFKIDYVMPGDDTADAVTVEFFNANTWKPDEVTASLPDSAAEQPRQGVAIRLHQ